MESLLKAVDMFVVVINYSYIKWPLIFVIVFSSKLLTGYVFFRYVLGIKPS